MRVFVCYTIRDNKIDKEKLRFIDNKLNETNKVFIDLIHNKSLIPQLTVVKNLIAANVIVLIVSPKVYDSPWVRFELRLAKLLRKKIISVDLEELSIIMDKIKVGV